MDLRFVLIFSVFVVVSINVFARELRVSSKQNFAHRILVFPSSAASKAPLKFGIEVPISNRILTFTVFFGSPLETETHCGFTISRSFNNIVALQKLQTSGAVLSPINLENGKFFLTVTESGQLTYINVTVDLGCSFGFSKFNDTHEVIQVGMASSFDTIVVDDIVVVAFKPGSSIINQVTDQYCESEKTATKAKYAAIDQPDSTKEPAWLLAVFTLIAILLGTAMGVGSALNILRYDAFYKKSNAVPTLPPPPPPLPQKGVEKLPPLPKEKLKSLNKSTIFENPLPLNDPPGPPGSETPPPPPPPPPPSSQQNQKVPPPSEPSKETQNQAHGGPSNKVTPSSELNPSKGSAQPFGNDTTSKEQQSKPPTSSNEGGKNKLKKGSEQDVKKDGNPVAKQTNDQKVEGSAHDGQNKTEKDKQKTGATIADIPSMESFADPEFKK